MKSAKLLVIVLFLSTLSINISANAQGVSFSHDSTIKLVFETKVKRNIKVADSVIRNHSSADESGLVLKSNKLVHKLDNRRRKGLDSPAVLDAVGRLSVTASNGKRSTCSANLMGLTSKQNSRVIITAAHCLKGDNLVWQTSTKLGKDISISAKVLQADHAADYAVLLLEKAVSSSDVRPLIMDYEYEEEFDNIALDYKDDAVIVAGYSSDLEIGKNGNVLTYDEHPKGIYPSQSKAGGEVRSFTYGGASGGAVIVTGINLENEQASPGEQNYLVGIIKGIFPGGSHTSGNGKIGSAKTVLVKYEHFLNSVKSAVTQYN